MITSESSVLCARTSIPLKKCGNECVENDYLFSQCRLIFAQHNRNRWLDVEPVTGVPAQLGLMCMFSVSRVGYGAVASMHSSLHKCQHS